MKPEQYRKLTLNQKMEYEHIYKTDIPQGTWMFIILFYSLMGTFSAIGLVALKSYVGLVPGDALKFFRLGFEAGGLLAALFCFDYILQWSYYIYKYYKEKKWLDEILHDNNRRYDKKAK